MNCGNLIRSSEKCTPPAGGVENVLYLIDKKKMLSFIRNENKDAIENFFTSGNGYQYKGIRRSLAPTQEIAADSNINYIHRVSFLILEVSNAQKKNIQNLTRGRYVAIVENVDKDNDSVFEVYGLNYGLEVQSGILRELNNVENSAAWTLELLSNQEPLLPESIWNGNYLDSKALVLARMLSTFRDDFLISDGGFVGDTVGTILWTYLSGWNITGLINGDVSEKLDKTIDIVSTEKHLYSSRLQLSSAGIVLAGSISLDVLINDVIIHTYLNPEFDTLLDDELYFYHSEPVQPEKISFVATFTDITNAPILKLLSLDIAKM